MADPRGTVALRALVRVAAAAGSFVAALWGVVYWVEAEKELRVLCAMSTPGKDVEAVARMFATANLLRIETVEEGTSRTLRATSPRNLHQARCTVTMRDGVVVMARREVGFRLAMPAALVLLLGLSWHSVLLARRALGTARTAESTSSSRSSPRWRAANGVTALLLAFGAVCVAQLTGVIRVAPLAGVATDVLWLLNIGWIGCAAWLVAAPVMERRWRRASLAAALALSGVVIALDPPATVAQMAAAVKLSDTPVR